MSIAAGWLKYRDVLQGLVWKWVLQLGDALTRMVLCTPYKGSRAPGTPCKPCKPCASCALQMEKIEAGHKSIVSFEPNSAASIKAQVCMRPCGCPFSKCVDAALCVMLPQPSDSARFLCSFEANAAPHTATLLFSANPKCSLSLPTCQLRIGRFVLQRCKFGQVQHLRWPPFLTGGA